MTSMLKLVAVIGAAVIATGTAHAQQGGPPAGGGAPAGPGYTAENNTVRNGGDTADADAERARQQGIDSARKRERDTPNSNRSVPAKPEEVTVGAEVRDPKGAVVGSVASVSMGAAVIATPGGKVEVPLEAFGKNKEGLLIPMSKADFDKAVADANKPK